MEGQRTHDRFYLKEDYKNSPKEYYKFVKSFIEQDSKMWGGEDFKLLDVGCETGSFLHYIRKEFPQAKLAGMDVMQELLDEVNHPTSIDASVINGDISATLTIETGAWDAVTMLGVLSIFDDFKPVIKNLMSLITPKGCVYIFSVFNPETVDMIMRCRASRSDGEWEKGWNIFSEDSVSCFIEREGWKHKFAEFHMPFDIPRHEDDPLRSWTVNMNGRLTVINGLQLIHNFRLLKIWK